MVVDLVLLVDPLARLSWHLHAHNVVLRVVFEAYLWVEHFNLKTNFLYARISLSIQFPFQSDYFRDYHVNPIFGVTNDSVAKNTNRREAIDELTDHRDVFNVCVCAVCVKFSFVGESLLARQQDVV